MLQARVPPAGRPARALPPAARPFRAVETVVYADQSPGEAREPRRSRGDSRAGARRLSVEHWPRKRRRCRRPPFAGTCGEDGDLPAETWVSTVYIFVSSGGRPSTAGVGR